MVSALLVLALAAAAVALPPAAPVSPLKGLEARANACDAAKDVVNILKLNGQAASFCSSVLHITPATRIVTATTTPPPAVITQTVVGTNTATVTNVALTTSEKDITEIFTATITDTEFETRTIVVTQTALTTTTVVPLAKRTVPSPTALKGIASSLVSTGCSCLSLPTSTVTSTTTVAGATQTSTAIVSATAVVTQTVSVASQVIVTSTIDVTATEVQTFTDEATVTATTVETVVATVTAGPTCGTNLVVNGDFPAPQYAPFVETSTGNAAPQFNAGCGTDPYCPLFIVNNGGGSETLTQTVATFPGQTYTLSFLYNNFGASAGASLACSVDVAGSTPVGANLRTVTGTRFVLASGSFKATGASTVLTCTGSTAGDMASNVQAIHIMC